MSDSEIKALIDSYEDIYDVPTHFRDLRKYVKYTNLTNNVFVNSLKAFGEKFPEILPIIDSYRTKTLQIIESLLGKTAVYNCCFCDSVFYSDYKYQKIKSDYFLFEDRTEFMDSLGTKKCVILCKECYFTKPGIYETIRVDKKRLIFVDMGDYFVFECECLICSF